MITTFITATIVWFMATGFNPCDEPNIACYMGDTHTIYVKKNLRIYDGFVLYHEIGHSLFKKEFDDKIFKQGVFTQDYETIADSFAWWIYSQKHPTKIKTIFTKDSPVSKEQIDYFEEKCPRSCVKEILAIKIK